MKNKRYTQNKTKLRNGEYQRSNKTFQYSWYDKSGKRHYLYAKTLPELRKKEEELLRDTLDGIDYTKLNATINSYFELWKKVKTGIRETTFASYVRYYKRYVEPEFGKMKLRDVTYSSIVMFLKDTATKRNLSFGSIRNIKVVLSMVIDVAVKDDVLKGNPCRGVLREFQREYEKDTKEVRALTLKEQKIFESFLAKPGKYHRYYPVFTVMLWTGMRVGEVLGLRWEDIDFENNEININHTLLYYDKGKGDGSDYKINPPKTKNSKRTVPMLPVVREALLKEKEFQDLFGIKCESVIDGYTDFVFLNSKGHVWHHKKLNYKLTKICEAINAEMQGTGDEFPHVHNHMLRHTFATRMREAGADMKAVSDMMGHEGILITLKTYTDASREFKNREIAVLKDYYETAI